LKDNIQLKNRLKVARAEKNLSQEQLAILAGVTRQTISSIETGQYCPTAKLALILAKVLNKQFEDLFYFEEVIDDVRKNG
jgi:putative transcriptional regulator